MTELKTTQSNAMAPQLNIFVDMQTTAWDWFTSDNAMDSLVQVFCVAECRMKTLTSNICAVFVCAVGALASNCRPGLRCSFRGHAANSSTTFCSARGTGSAQNQHKCWMCGRRVVKVPAYNRCHVAVLKVHGQGEIHGLNGCHGGKLMDSTCEVPSFPGHQWESERMRPVCPPPPS